MNLFLAAELTDTDGKLGEEETHHAYRVLRMQAGDDLLVTLGKGIIYKAEITYISKKKAQFKLGKIFRHDEAPAHNHIAIAPTKSNDRFENFLEKATEMGVAEITPIFCENSERKVYIAERGQKVIASAAKQSLSAWWPLLNEPQGFAEFINHPRPRQAATYIAYCGDGDKTELLPQLPHLDNVVVMIGPEGDFSPREVKLARGKDFQVVSLGPKRLRTETAGIAVAMAHALI